jgi:VanZ family protein
MKIKYFAPAVVWGLFVLVLSTMPGEDIPNFQWADLFSVDKLVHALFYGIFVFLLYWGYKKHRMVVPLLGILLFCIGFGVSMELIQKFFCRGRMFELADILANSFGACLVWWGLSRGLK